MFILDCFLYVKKNINNYRPKLCSTVHIIILLEIVLTFITGGSPGDVVKVPVM